jgi:hypothetical protein
MGEGAVMSRANIELVIILVLGAAIFALAGKLDAADEQLLDLQRSTRELQAQCESLEATAIRMSRDAELKMIKIHNECAASCGPWMMEIKK